MDGGLLSGTDTRETRQDEEQAGVGKSNHGTYMYKGMGMKPLTRG